MKPNDFVHVKTLNTQGIIIGVYTTENGTTYEVLYHSQFDYKHNWCVPDESWHMATPGNFLSHEIIEENK